MKRKTFLLKCSEIHVKSSNKPHVLVSHNFSPLVLKKRNHRQSAENCISVVSTLGSKSPEDPIKTHVNMSSFKADTNMFTAQGVGSAHLEERGPAEGTAIVRLTIPETFHPTISLHPLSHSQTFLFKRKSLNLQNISKST